MSAIYHNGHWYGGGQDIDIQSDPTATSFESGKVPTGGTIESVLNSNLVFDLIEKNMTIPANDKAEIEITSDITKTGYDIKLVTVYSISSTVMPVIELSNSRYFVLARNFHTSVANTKVYVAVMYKKTA